MTTIQCNMAGKECLERTRAILYLGKFDYLYEPGMTIEQAHKQIKEHIVYIDALVRKTFGNKYTKICYPGLLSLYTDAQMLVCHEEEPEKPENPDKPKCFEDGGPDDPNADLYENNIHNIPSERIK